MNTAKTYTKTDRNGRVQLFVVGAKTGKHYRVACRTVGANFGTVGCLMSGKTVVAEGETRPLGFHGQCRQDAIDLAATR